MERKTPSRLRRWIPALLLALAAAGAGEARAQERPERGTIAGLIVDARSQGPLADATVVLETRAPGALPSRAGAFLPATRTARTDATGRYRFEGVPPGEYRLHVQRLGYRSATVEVDLRGPESRVSVGLDVEPVALEPVSVTAPGMRAGESYGRWSVQGADGESTGRRRVAVERRRQELHLPGDVRAVTHEDVAGGITLGETDLFRALQRLPGVSAGDEYSAELWTRGASWDQTRVYFDGLPLFNPVHALGGFSGVNPDAVGAAFLHPGMQPVSLGGGAAGALDLRTRPGGGDGSLRGLGELSLVSARLALERTSEDGRHAYATTMRRSYLDLVTGMAEQALGQDRTYRMPYSFRDLTARYDYRIGEGSALEVSGLLQNDEIRSRNSNLLNRISADWGGGAVRATLQNRFGGVQARHTLGVSGFASSLREQNADPDPNRIGISPAIRPSSNRIAHAAFRGELEPVGTSAPAAWSAGYELVNQTVRFDGPRPLPLALIDPSPSLLDRGDRLPYASLWGNRRWHPAGALTLSTGVRVEAGPAVENGGPVRLAPRLAARLQATPALSLSAALGRSYQYVQAVAPSGAPAEEGFLSDYLWVLAGEDVPAARADVATLGAEHWLGAGWLGGVTAYARRTTGVAVPDPTPGPLREKPLFASGTGTARGVELSVRRLAGAWTATGAYSYGVSEVEAEGLRFPAPSDQRHALDLTAVARVGAGWQLGAAYTLASGVPYTRTFQGKVRCTLDRTCAWAEEPWAGEPGAFRTPAYQSLDLLAEWNREYRTWSLGVFLQLHNALNHANPGRYVGFGGEYCVDECWWSYEGKEFLAGLPVLPVIGARIAF